MKNIPTLPLDPITIPPHDNLYWLDDPTARLRGHNQVSCLGTFEESLESIDKLINKKLIE